MIRNFWVKNYLSIRDKQELNFVAEERDSVLTEEVAEGVFLYKLAILYGSNASGKSNMLIALNKVFRLLIQAKSNSKIPIGNVIPFALTENEPTEMFVSFYANGIRYDYEVKFNKNNILSEELYYYPNDAKTLFYERKFVDENIQTEIRFGETLGLETETQKDIRKDTLNNQSVLSVCRSKAYGKDIAPFNRLYDWIMINYHDIDGDEKKGIVEILREAYNNPKKRKFYNIMLRKADLNILEYKPIAEDRYIQKSFRERIEKENIPQEVKDELLKPIQESISFTNYSKNKEFEIPLKLQSKGTTKYILILEVLFDMITGSQVYYLDELGEDLHKDLLFYYLNVFLFNSEKSQLIITSQETTLLSQDLINENRGVIWLVEKNRETASSEYFRGDSFGLDKDLSFYDSYSIGRLGAKPDLGSIFINLED
ncbi:MAG: ATP-binding protein [Bacteroidales bacterium]|nr:ATP-binding protein [Bacteroidales bacterium]MEE1252292.1 ATP-binding protein [Bacteroidales bacterium]